MISRCLHRPPSSTVREGLASLRSAQTTQTPLGSCLGLALESLLCRPLLLLGRRRRWRGTTLAAAGQRRSRRSPSHTCRSSSYCHGHLHLHLHMPFFPFHHDVCSSTPTGWRGEPAVATSSGTIIFKREWANHGTGGWWWMLEDIGGGGGARVKQGTGWTEAPRLAHGRPSAGRCTLTGTHSLLCETRPLSHTR